jgi:hypothetical protein
VDFVVEKSSGREGLKNSNILTITLYIYERESSNGITLDLARNGGWLATLGPILLLESPRLQSLMNFMLRQPTPKYLISHLAP